MPRRHIYPSGLIEYKRTPEEVKLYETEARSLETQADVKQLNTRVSHFQELEDKIEVLYKVCNQLYLEVDTTAVSFEDLINKAKQELENERNSQSENQPEVDETPKAIKLNKRKPKRATKTE